MLGVSIELKYKHYFSFQFQHSIIEMNIPIHSQIISNEFNDKIKFTTKHLSLQTFHLLPHLLQTTKVVIGSSPLSVCTWLYVVSLSPHLLHLNKFELDKLAFGTWASRIDCLSISSLSFFTSSLAISSGVMQANCSGAMTPFSTFSFSLGFFSSLRLTILLLMRLLYLVPESLKSANIQLSILTASWVTSPSNSES